MSPEQVQVSKSLKDQSRNLFLRYNDSDRAKAKRSINAIYEKMVEEYCNKDMATMRQFQIILNSHYGKFIGRKEITFPRRSLLVPFHFGPHVLQIVNARRHNDEEREREPNSRKQNLAAWNLPCNLCYLRKYGINCIRVHEITGSCLGSIEEPHENHFFRKVK